MKIKLPIIIAGLFLITSQITTAQNTFLKTYGGLNNDYCTYVQQTSDGGYIMAGYTNNFGAGSMEDIYLVRTNSTGDTLWTKTYGGTGQERAYAVAQTSDGGFIITGYTNSFGVVNADVYLIRTDGNGNTVWSKTYGGDGLDFGYAVKQTSDGGFIVAGSTDLGSANGSLYLLKIRSNGDTLFTKVIGGTGIDRASAIRQTTDGGFIIGGYTSSFGAGGNDFYLLKTTSAGNISWEKTYGGANSDQGNDVQQTSDGGYIFAGNSMSFGAGAYDVYLIKTDANGVATWSKTYGGVNSEYGNAVQQTIDGGYIIAGYSASFPGDYLIKTDAAGNPLWTKTIGGPVFDWGNSMQQTIDGGFIIGGYTMSFGAGNMDLSLIKTDANGNISCSEVTPATITAPAATQTGSPISQVTSGGQVRTPATVGHSGGTVSTVCFTTAVNEQTAGNSIAVAPNPFNREIIIRGTKENETLLVSDFAGRIILQQPADSGETRINSENILPGVYVISIVGGNTNKSYKVVKY
ncbi:MAG: T9SS type A sorting domain-containing protein [bacterium]